MGLVYQSHISDERWETLNSSQRTPNEEHSMQNLSLQRSGWPSPFGASHSSRAQRGLRKTSRTLAKRSISATVL